MEKEKSSFGLSAAEWENLKSGARYIATIVIAVLITFLVVAGIAGFFDYTPPSPTNHDSMSEVTPEISPEPTAVVD